MTIGEADSKMTDDPQAMSDAAPSQAARRRSLSRVEVTLELALCGVLIAGLPMLSRHLGLDVRRATVVLGLVSGGLCLVWSVLSRRRRCVLWGAVPTLAAATLVFLAQAFESWHAAPALEAKGRMAVAMMAVLSVFCAGTVISLARGVSDQIQRS